MVRGGVLKEYECYEFLNGFSEKGIDIWKRINQRITLNSGFGT
jgi:hypothetical protein